MTENEAIKITSNNATEKEINLKTLYQLVEKFNRGHWGDIQLFEDEENRYSTVIEKVIEEIQQYRAIGTVEELQDMKNKYQEAVVDWRQYRKIGTIEELKALKDINRVADNLSKMERIEYKALKEKNEPKKPYIQQIVKDFREHDCYECPNCDCFVGYVSECQEEHYQDIYCPNCGQKLDWQ